MKNKSFLIAIGIVISVIINGCGNSDEFEPQFNHIDNLFSHPIIAYDLSIDKNDNKWIATSGGLVKYNNGQKTIFTKVNGLTNDTVYHVTADSLNHIWCLTKDRESICEYDGTKFTVHRPSTISHKMTFPTAIMVDSRNHIWVGAYLGLYEFDGTKWKNHYYHSAATNSWARSLYPDPEVDGNILIITWNDEIIRFNGTSYQKLDKLFDIDSNLFKCIAEDNKGVIYCGVALKGLLIRTRGTNKIISLGNEIGDNFINDISCGPDGRVWMVTDKGLFYLEKETIYNFKNVSFGADPYKGVTIDSRGKPWFQSFSGLISMK